MKKINLIFLNFFLFLIIFLNYINAFQQQQQLRSKRIQIQQASFHFLSATGYRASLTQQEWCEEYQVVGGRDYYWSDFRSMAITYLDLYISLQFDVECEPQLIEFRKFFIINVNQPPAYSKNSTFWDTTYLQLALNSFTCGFNGSKIEDFDFVSNDLRNNFNADEIKQKVWFLIGDYITSEFKQRENSNRRMDYDSGLYIPFLDRYSGTDYTSEQQIRAGYPSFMGRSLWFIFHTVAQRISDSQCESDPNSNEIYNQITVKVKNFMTSFLYQHPCPICREHQISRIFVNDRYAKDPIDNEAIRYYPIEHLLMGGIRGDTFGKISTMIPTDKKSISSFFWKLHNAITSSVDNGCQCFTQEYEDKSPYKCVFDYKLQIQPQFPRQQRLFPFGKRFEFFLSPDHNYTLFDEIREQFIPIVTEINQLDTFALRKELFQYWSNGVSISKKSQTTVNQLLSLITNMTTQFMNSNVLSASYSYQSDLPLQCNLILEKLNASTHSLSTPTIRDAFPPSVCNPYLQPSVCDQQYLYKYFTQPPVTSPPKSTKNVEPINSTTSTTSTSKSSTGSSFRFKINFILIIVLILSIFSF
ncbi:hypothetical protein RB653_001625 [Dictyostelium firmibasis]|uniref:Sulfhydryl oxidase n=1 Tax=Dictyostelium firmibasis TaxID=79012 RepID=A0AAN7U4B9_9MYCE